MLTRPVTAPDFLLSRPHGSVRTQGSRQLFTNPWEAAAAIREKKCDFLVGALPFDIDDKCALRVPETIIRSDGPLEPPEYYRRGLPLNARLKMMVPSKTEHLNRVAAAVATIRNTALEKVVLARTVGVEFNTDDPIDPLEIAARLIHLSPERNAFLADISLDDAERRWIVGSSPEVLVKLSGNTVSCYPLAGSAARHPDPVKDEGLGQNLLRSEKDLWEHKLVVDHIVTALKSLCTSVNYSPTPELKKTAEMWHLATPITGTIATNTTALDVALRLHPTPAICGTPTEIARDLILQVETDRSFYAGAVGWCSSDGDGEYVVSIRCAETDGRFARAWAGGGLVASSIPDDEVAETDAKLRTIMRALGL